MVSTDTKLSVGLATVAVILWYITLQFTESTVVQIAVLVGTGVVLPLVVNEWRTRSGSRP